MFIRLARPVATVLVLAVAVAALWGAERDRSAASELVFLVQYIGSDYDVAVRDGRVVDAFERTNFLKLYFWPLTTISFASETVTTPPS